MKVDFHSHFSDDYAQKEYNTCKHMKNFIDWMYEVFNIKYGIIYYTIDGCSK